MPLNLLDPLRTGVVALAMVVDLIGVVVVSIAVIRASSRYLAALLHRAQPFPPEGMRVELGRSLALSLEFLLGADILRTAIEPTWDEIARLAAIGSIRIVLNFFLDRELAEERRRGPIAPTRQGEQREADPLA